MKAYPFGGIKCCGIFMVTTGILVLFTAGATARAQSISMSYVTVENPNNAPDPATGNMYGSVSYTYDIGEYDVTQSQYVTFLNAVDPTGANPLGLYDSIAKDMEYGIVFNPNGENGSMYSVRNGYSNMPIVDETYWDAIRFVNWMNNGEGNASTETGAYTLLGYLPLPLNWATVTRNPGATVWLPSEDEWYKAAYYNPTIESYSTYATQSNTVPGNIVGNGLNEANFEYYNGSVYLYSVTQSSIDSPGQIYLTSVGSFSNSASSYGTYDQSGDAFNWTDTLYDSGGDGSRVARGGSCFNASVLMASSYRGSESTLNEDPLHGFRVASVPEPSSIILVMVGAVGLLCLRSRSLEIEPSECEMHSTGRVRDK